MTTGLPGNGSGPQADDGALFEIEMLASDFAEATFVDSAVIGVSIAAHQRAAKTVRIFGLRPANQPRRTLELVGVYDLLTVDEDSDDTHGASRNDVLTLETTRPCRKEER